MKAENIAIASIKTANDCCELIDAIEHDKRNYTCTDREWVQGYQCNLKVAAKRKIEAITRKLHSLPDSE